MASRLPPIFLIALTTLLFCFYSLTLSAIVAPSLSHLRRLSAGQVAILIRQNGDGSLKAELTDGHVIMSYKLRPFPAEGVTAGVKDCQLAFDSLESLRVMNQVDVRIEYLGGETVADLVDACNKISVWGEVDGIATKILLPKYKENNPYLSLDDIRNAINTPIPGTKWCGPGDTAQNEEDLGPLADVDACCRDHDLCPYNVHAFQTKDHFWNWRPHTVSQCACDEKFFNCLKGATENPTVATSVGKAYFDVVGPPCLKKEYGTYCRQWHWSHIWCEATGEGMAAIPYTYLDGSWSKGNSVTEVLESLGTSPTPVPPIKQQ